MQYVDVRIKTFHQDGTATFREHTIKYFGSMNSIQREKRLRELLEKRDGNMRITIFHSLPYEM